tara:strand:+ start:135 stop:581 length:447 start_codon:yes stop_codon:yes gene_type:complete
MTPTDSPDGAVCDMTNPADNRDNSREIPAMAIAPLQAARDAPEKHVVSNALKAVSDAFLIHPGCFDQITRGPSKASKARLVAIEMAVRWGGLSPWAASKAFELDLSTIKNALARAPEIAGSDKAYARARQTAHSTFRAGLQQPGASHG